MIDAKISLFLDSKSPFSELRFINGYVSVPISWDVPVNNGTDVRIYAEANRIVARGQTADVRLLFLNPSEETNAKTGRKFYIWAGDFLGEGTIVEKPLQAATSTVRRVTVSPT